MNPKARTDGVLVTELEGELVLYDERGARAHRLNRTAATVWQLADGTRTIADLAARVAEDLGGEPDEQLIELSLAKLEEVELLETTPTLARRDMLRKVAVTAALAPAIWSIAAPTPVQARSDDGLNQNDAIRVRPMTMPELYPDS